MALKDFDYKQFLLDKGERVGLYAAGGLAVLLIGLSLFWPGKGLFSGSPVTKANEIRTVAQEKNTRANSQQEPNENEKDTLRKVDPQLLKQASNVALDPAALRLPSELFAPREIPSNKRQNPNILPPEDFVAEVVPAQISTYMFQQRPDGRLVAVLEPTEKDKPIRKPGTNRTNMIKGVLGGGASGGGMPGGGVIPGFNQNAKSQRGMGSGMSMGGGPGAKPDDAFTGGGDKKGFDLKWRRENELTGQNITYARDLLPKEVAIISGAFPLRAQVDEFQKALRLDSRLSVFNEKVISKDKKQKQGFRFLGFEVQRKVYGPDGKPVVTEGDGWQPLDLNSDDSPYMAIMHYGVNWDATPEDPKLSKLFWPNMVLERPVQRSLKPDSNDPKDSKPYDESDLLSLPKIKRTLAKLTPEQKTVIPKSKFEEGGTRRPFEQDVEETKPDTNPDQPAAKDSGIPEYCVIRFLDVTIQPGKTYEYRIRVHMANPNYKKPENEVANQQLTDSWDLWSDWTYVKRSRYQVRDEALAALRGDGVTEPELQKLAALKGVDFASEDDFTKALAAQFDKQALDRIEKPILTRSTYYVPLRISAPGEMHFYAVDEADIKARQKETYRGTNPPSLNNKLDPTRQTVIQVHRWMKNHEKTRGKDTEFYPVGDWVVGERIITFRGEYLGQKPTPTHLPIWSYEDNSFILLGTKPKGSVRGDTRPTEDVIFFPNLEQTPLLVDFDGGMSPAYKHTGAPVVKNPDDTGTDTPKTATTTPGEVKPVPQSSELLLLTPDGRLLARDSGADEDNPERRQRVDDYEARVANAEGKEPTKPADKPK